MSSAEKWQIQPVCKKCAYRKSIGGSFSNNSWQNTVCNYICETGKLRDGPPQGEYCPNFKPKPKSRRRKLY